MSAHWCLQRSIKSFTSIKLLPGLSSLTKHWSIFSAMDWKKHWNIWFSHFPPSEELTRKISNDKQIYDFYLQRVKHNIFSTDVVTRAKHFTKRPWNRSFEKKIEPPWYPALIDCCFKLLSWNQLSRSKQEKTTGIYQFKEMLENFMLTSGTKTWTSLNTISGKWTCIIDHSKFSWKSC